MVPLMRNVTLTSHALVGKLKTHASELNPLVSGLNAHTSELKTLAS